MKAILAILGAILLIGLSGAVMYDLGDILKGDQMNPSGALWLKDDAVLYFGTDKDGSLKFNSTSGYLEMVGLTAYDNTSITVTSGEDITFAGGDSELDLSAGSGIWKMPAGAGTIAGTTDFNDAITCRDITLDANKNFTMSGTGTLTTGTGGNTLAGDTTVSSNKAMAITTADKLTVAGVIVPQETVINVPIDPSEVDQSVFIADDAWQITKIEEVHAVAQNTAFPNTGNLTIRKCTGTEAPSAGDAMHNTTMWLNSTVNTVVTPTLSGVSTNLTLADGNRIALDFNGTTSTLAGGVLTIHMKRV